MNKSVWIVKMKKVIMITTYVLTLLLSVGSNAHGHHAEAHVMIDRLVPGMIKSGVESRLNPQINKQNETIRKLSNELSEVKGLVEAILRIMTSTENNDDNNKSLNKPDMQKESLLKLLKKIEK